jgi:hypothetical protein
MSSVDYGFFPIFFMPYTCVNGALHTPQRLQGLDHRLKPLGLHLLVECVCETGQAVSGLVHGPDIFLADEWLYRGRIDHRRAPVQGGWLFDGSVRLRCSLAPGRVPMAPRKTPSGGWSSAPSATAIES